MSAPQPPDVLSEVSDFISRYLQCSYHQRTLLALWVLHTYCYQAAEITPYLSIQSRYKHSGKTLCLRILDVLCDGSALTSHLAASNLLVRMRLKPASAFLLDQCHYTFGTRSRGKAPTLRALLTGSVHWDIGFPYGLNESQTFCPKAFAGNGDLPEDIADYSISIILQPIPIPVGNAGKSEIKIKNLKFLFPVPFPHSVSTLLAPASRPNLFANASRTGPSSMLLFLKICLLTLTPIFPLTSRPANRIFVNLFFSWLTPSAVSGLRVSVRLFSPFSLSRPTSNLNPLANCWLPSAIASSITVVLNFFPPQS